MKKSFGFKVRSVLSVVCFAALAVLSGCGAVSGYNEILPDAARDDSGYKTFVREVKDMDFSAVPFAPWDVEAVSKTLKKRQAKPYTVMVYMNGSDLESVNGAATKDILEMLDSGLDAQNANLLLFTGGTKRWQNNAISSNSCGLWEIADGVLYKIADIGLCNMGNAGTLASFIDFGLLNFPAEKYGLIFWDHGGGSIAGFGHDEKFKTGGSLSLLEINCAFEKSRAKTEPLEFLGFDSCLMATVETAVVASDYARYLIASEDLEPGDGWDYGFLSALNTDSGLDGAALGKAAADRFIRFYGANPTQDLTLSVTDLQKSKGVMEAMGRLMNVCAGDLVQEPSAAFKLLADKRNNTKTFGIGSPRDNESDMVDLREMALQLSGVYPDEVGAVLDALDGAVLYNVHNSDFSLGGLSAFYIYGGKKTGTDSLNVYASLKMDANYTEYLVSFYKILSKNSGYSLFRNTPAETAERFTKELTAWEPAGGQDYIMKGIQGGGEVRGGLWPRINGQDVCLFPLGGSQKRRMFAVPVCVNGKDADLIIVITETYPDGLILGIRNEEGFILQKGYDEVQANDTVAFYYPVMAIEGARRADKGWQKGMEFKVDEDGLEIEWAPHDGKEIIYSNRYKDAMHNEYFDGFKTVPLPEIAV